jgi:hypothetical protein
MFSFLFRLIVIVIFIISFSLALFYSVFLFCALLIMVFVRHGARVETLLFL